MTAEMAKGCEMKVKNTQEKISVEVIIEKKDPKVDIRQVFKDILAKPKLSNLQIRFTKDGYTLNKNEENGLLNSVPEIMDIFLNIYGNAYQSGVSRGNKEDLTDAANNIAHKQDGHGQSINEIPHVSNDEQEETIQTKNDNGHAADETNSGQDEIENRCKSNCDEESEINIKNSTTDSVPPNIDATRTYDAIPNASSKECRDSYENSFAPSRKGNPESIGESSSHQQNLGIHHEHINIHVEHNTVTGDARKKPDNNSESHDKRTRDIVESTTDDGRMKHDSSKDNRGERRKDNVDPASDDGRMKHDSSKDNRGERRKDNVDPASGRKKEDLTEKSERTKAKVYSISDKAGKREDIAKENSGEAPQDETKFIPDDDRKKLGHRVDPSGSSTH